MRSHKDRRRAVRVPPCLTAENGRALLVSERRKRHARRLENMQLEERQLQLSEMPGLDTDKHR